MAESSSSIQPHRLRRLFKALVDIYSPTGKEEEILHYMRGYLRRQGLQVISQPVDDRRFNLVVMPPETEVELALIGHLDTVVACALESYEFVAQGDLIRGLGTADMKGGCAAMVEAYVSAQRSSSFRLPAALCLVVGEEGEGDGIQRLVEEYRLPWAIIGEPTELSPCLSNYGYMEIQLSTAGERVHASLASRAGNPVEVMMHTILGITRYTEGLQPALVCNIRDLFSARAGFAVPDRCEAWLDIHLPPGAPIGEIRTEIEDIAERQKQDYPTVETSLRIATIDAGYELPEKGLLIDLLKGLYARNHMPWDPMPFISHSDANRLWRSGVKPVLMGPGSLSKAHAPDESVRFEQVCLAAELYQDLLRRMAVPA